jgi:hypothetical protein
MEQMHRPAAQNQCAERARHSVQARIGAPLSMDPAIDRISRVRADASDAARDRLFETSFDEAAYGQFGSNAPALGAAHAIRQRGDDVDRELPSRRADITRCEILVPRPCARMRVLADDDMQARAGGKARIWCVGRARIQS